MRSSSASACGSVSGASSVIGVGRRMPAGTAAWTSASSESKPSVASISAESLARGPMWRSANGFRGNTEALLLVREFRVGFFIHESGKLVLARELDLVKPRAPRGILVDELRRFGECVVHFY